MLVLTPTMFGSVLAGVALWLMFWYGVDHVDSIPYLNQYLSRRMILDWIKEEPTNSVAANRRSEPASSWDWQCCSSLLQSRRNSGQHCRYLRLCSHSELPLHRDRKDQSSEERVMTKRQRHVFPNREIPHLWAHQTQDEARNGTGSFYFRGATIYSYGSHFPIATHVKGSQGQPGILFTSAKNSVTTSQHMSMVNRSIPPDVPVFTVPICNTWFLRSLKTHINMRRTSSTTREK